MLPRTFYRLRLRYLLVAIIALYAAEYLGAFTHLFERRFEPATFDWPLAGDVRRLANAKRLGRPSNVADIDASAEPINLYNHTLLRSPAHKCRHSDGTLLPSVRLLFLVKSAMPNFDRRQAIRSSWGFERRLSDVVIRTVFLLGTADARTEREPAALQHLIDVEAERFRDLVQADFRDTYFNNTVKTMIGFRWAAEHCPRAQFYMFVDDDYYVSAKNVLRFVRNPVNYPEYLEDADETMRKLARRLSAADPRAKANDSTLLEAQRALQANGDAASRSYENRRYAEQIARFVAQAPAAGRDRIAARASSAAAATGQSVGRKLTMDTEIGDGARLFAGFVFRSAPHRHRSSKWYVSLDEYPWHQWPTYVTAGAFVVSREALLQMYYVSMFTRHFRFDDIFLGIVALKADIEPLHCEEFAFHKAQFSGPHSYRYLIASHGYTDPVEMTRVWTESRAAGNA